MVDDNPYESDDPRINAVVDMIRRTGAAETQLRCCDQQQPEVWIAVVKHRVGPDGRPRPHGPINSWETAAGHDPLEAMLRLCEQLIDGGTCAHCAKPTMFYGTETVATPFDEPFCITQWDPPKSGSRAHAS